MAKLPDITLQERPTPKAVTGGAQFRGVTGMENVWANALKEGASDLNAVANYLRQAQEQQDTLIAQDKHNEYVKSLRDLELGDDGFTKRLGKNGIGKPLYDDYVKRANDIAKGLEQGLTEPQMEKFRNRVGVSDLSYTSHLLKHMADQQKVFEADVYTNNFNTNISQITDRPDDDVTFNTSMASLVADAKLKAQREGLDERSLVAATVATATEDRLHSLRLKNPVMAMDVFYQNKDVFIDARKQAQLQEQLFIDAAPVMAQHISTFSKEKFLPNAPAELRLANSFAITVDNAKDAAMLLTKASKEGLMLKVEVGKPKTVIDQLPMDQKLRLIDAAGNMVEQKKGEARLATKYEFEDALSNASRNLPHSMTREKLVDAFGQVEGERSWQVLETAAKTGKDTAAYETMPATAIIADVEKSKPTAFTPMPAIAEKAAEFKERKANAIFQERNADPARYVIDKSPPATDAFKAYAAVQANPLSTPEERKFAAQRYSASVLSEQQRLEIIEPKLLPKQLAESIASQINNPPQDSTTGNVMRGKQEEFGPYFPALLSQIKKGLKSTAIVLSQPSGVPSMVEQQLEEIGRMPDDALYKGMEKSDRDVIKQAVSTHLAEFNESIRRSRDGLFTYDAYADVAEKLTAYYYSKGMAKNIKDAAKLATNFVVNNNYIFQDGYRIPIRSVGPMSTQRDIQFGAENLRRQVSQVGSIHLPTTLPGINKADIEAQYRNTLMNKSYWITAPGDVGLQLVVDASGDTFSVTEPDGKTPIMFTWEQLSAASDAPPPISPLSIEAP